jgi:hypothetical protein
MDSGVEDSAGKVPGSSLCWLRSGGILDLLTIQTALDVVYLFKIYGFDQIYPKDILFKTYLL